MTREIRFQIELAGKASPEDAMGERMNIETSAVLPPDFDPALAGSGLHVTCEAAVDNDEYGGFSETGTLSFGGGTLSYESVREGYLGETPDPKTQLGHVVFQVTGGTGSFAGASGFIVSAFTVNEDAQVRESQSAVLFLP